jgi:cytochrome c oxidase subunit 4
MMLSTARGQTGALLAGGQFGRVTCTRLASTEVQLSQTLKDQYYPKLGNRDIVAYGWNGYPTYIDRAEFPCPPVRFKENTPDVVALRAKELGDWKALSLADKKALYRASFRQTYAEFLHPTGEWKGILGMMLIGMSLTGLLFTWVKHFVLPPLPETITAEWQEKQLEHMIRQRQGPVDGISSLWDYEKNTWK